jgi:hypothetical protein
LTGAPFRTSIRRVRKWFALFAASIASVIAVSACGARSGLRVDEAVEGAGPDVEDAGPDVADAPDAPMLPDVVVPDCVDAGITYIYLISSQNELIRFYPPDLSITTIGTISCPTTTPANPFSMAVDRKGIAYVLFENGELFRVSTLTAICTATTYVSNSDLFPTAFGMGFSANKADQGETLFIAGTTTQGSGLTSRLGVINTENFAVSVGAQLSQDIGDPELTGTGDSRLFGFAPSDPFMPHFAEIDKATSKVLSDEILDLQLNSIAGWAFAAWGGDFYIFTSELHEGPSSIHRYTPGGSLSPPLVKQLDGLNIVGAGVSTCAPSE